MQAQVRATLRSVSPISRRGDGMFFDTFVGNPDINRGYPLAQIETPALVVSAVDDPMALHANARALAAQMPQARLLAVADGGHLMLGHAEEVRAAVAEFVRSAQ
jgi:pimeloyl-ACP methyl ester carboxylesterase